MNTNREKIARRRQRRRRRRLKTSFKIFLSFFIVLVCGGSIAGYGYYQKLHAPDPNGKLEQIQKEESNNFNMTEEVMPDADYWVLNVGKGESIYIKTGSTDILIDTGSEADAKAILKSLEGKLSGSLDYLIITSNSPGRLGGFRTVCQKLKPNKIISCDLGDQARAYRQMAEGTKIEEGTDSTLTLSEDCTLTIFRPEVSSEDPRDQSLMTLFTYGKTRFFAESDAGEEEEARVMDRVKDCDVLVLARAGSDEVNQHIEEIGAKTMVVSDAKGGGPAKSITEKLKSGIFTTYKSGNIKFTTNGNELTSNLKKEDAVGGRVY